MFSIGIECELSPESIIDLLKFFSQSDYDIHISHCMMIEDGQGLLPLTFTDGQITVNQLIDSKVPAVWELVFHVYPYQSGKRPILTYEDFVFSNCVCCIVYYDCASMDIYIKDSSLHERITDKLIQLDAKNLVMIDSQDRCRKIMLP